MRKFGSIPFDPKNLKIGFPLASAEKKERILRQYKVGGIRDQGYTPQCVGYALWGLLKAEPISQEPYTPTEIYKAARKFSKTPASVEGVKLNDAVDFLKDKDFVEQEYWTLSVDDVSNHLFTTSPVVLSIPWKEKMDTPASDGRVKLGGAYVGHHAVMAYCFDGLKKRIWMANSWGKAWGKEGLFYMTITDLGKLMGDGGLGCAIVEKRS